MPIEAKLTIKGFLDLFNDMLPLAKTQIQAYDLAEKWHEEKFGCNKYSDFNSFQAGRSRYKKKR